MANSFEVLPDEDSENDDNGDRSFKTKSSDNSDEDDMPGLEPMSDDMVTSNFERSTHTNTKLLSLSLTLQPPPQSILELQWKRFQMRKKVVSAAAPQ